MDWVLDQVLAQWQAQVHIIDVEIWLVVLYKYKRCIVDLYIGCVVYFLFGHLYRPLVKCILVLDDKCLDDVIDDVMMMSCGGTT